MENYEQLIKRIDRAIVEQTINSIALKKPEPAPKAAIVPKEKKALRLNIKGLM